MLESYISTICTRYSALVRVQGADSLGSKAHGQPFFFHQNGRTTFSASAIIIDLQLGIILTTKNIINPFLNHEDELSPDTLIQVMLPRDEIQSPSNDPVANSSPFLIHHHSDTLNLQSNELNWIEAKLIKLVTSGRVGGLLARLKEDSQWMFSSTSTAHWRRRSHLGRDHINDGEESRSSIGENKYHLYHQEEGTKGVAPWRQRESRHEGLKVSDPFSNIFHLKDLESIAVLKLVGYSPLYNVDYKMKWTPNPTLATSMDHLTKTSPLIFIGSPYGLLSPHTFINSFYSTRISNIIEEGQRIEECVERDEGEKKSQQSRAFKMDPNQRHHLSLKVLIIDQRVLPGCEGGGVFDINANLVGILAPSIRRTDQSKVQVNLVLPIGPYWEMIQELIQMTKNLYHHPLDLISLYRIPSDEIGPIHVQPVKQLETRRKDGIEKKEDDVFDGRMNLSSFDTSNSYVSSCFSSIVLISTKRGWGSGVLITQDGLILTAAHLIDTTTSPLETTMTLAHSITIRVSNENWIEKKASPSSQMRFIWYKASLISRSAFHLDIALLRLEDALPNQSQQHSYLDVTWTNLLFLHPAKIKKLDSNEYHDACNSDWIKKGHSIHVIGHSLFSPNQCIGASYAQGQISNMIYNEGQPLWIQTNAIVNKGASGGGIFDDDGYLIGIVTCNAIYQDQEVISNINFAVAIPALKMILDEAFNALSSIKPLEKRYDKDLIGVTSLINKDQEIGQENSKQSNIIMGEASKWEKENRMLIRSWDKEQGSQQTEEKFSLDCSQLDAIQHTRQLRQYLDQYMIHKDVDQRKYVEMDEDRNVDLNPMDKDRGMKELRAKL